MRALVACIPDWYCQQWFQPRVPWWATVRAAIETGIAFVGHLHQLGTLYELVAAATGPIFLLWVGYGNPVIGHDLQEFLPDWVWVTWVSALFFAHVYAIASRDYQLRAIVMSMVMVWWVAMLYLVVSRHGFVYGNIFQIAMMLGGLAAIGLLRSRANGHTQ